MDFTTLLQFKASRSLIDLGKLILTCLDELNKEAESAEHRFFNTVDSLSITESDKKLIKNIFIQSQVFTENKKTILRKRILDFGNDLVRELDKEFEKLKKQ
jgi:ferritin-like protein